MLVDRVKSSYSWRMILLHRLCLNNFPNRTFLFKGKRHFAYKYTNCISICNIWNMHLICPSKRQCDIVKLRIAGFNDTYYTNIPNTCLICSFVAMAFWRASSYEIQRAVSSIQGIHTHTYVQTYINALHILIYNNIFYIFILLPKAFLFNIVDMNEVFKRKLSLF